MSISKRKIREGQYLMVCDRTGFTVWSGENGQEYTGLRIRKRSIERRHPQEFVRGVPERQHVPVARPPGTPEMTGTLTTQTTAAADAGATQLAVESSVRFEPGDRLRIALASGDMFSTNNAFAVDSTTIEIVEPLPEAVEAGAWVENLSAASIVEVG